MFCVASLALAWFATALAMLPLLLKVAIALCCLVLTAWTLSRQVLLRGEGAWRRLRHDDEGWQLWSPRRGWQAVELRYDSLAPPALVLLRFRLPGQWLSRSLCLPTDSLPAEAHRRLRVRLRLARNRWSAPG
ncbi:MAG: hypothetical protein GAK45_00091 [Pseudomonas citronellolis]|nr:MAG: hypothetical protein GAK45_00091 [Pseudomonas citronellolis]